MKNITLNNKTIVITGAAGFIGANLAMTLLNNVENVKLVGIDNLNDYYNVELKKYRLKKIESMANSSSNQWKFIQGDIADTSMIQNIFGQYTPSIVVNLAAQAGVRYSITNPDAYIHSNIIGFYNILEACRSQGEHLEHLVYASSSSVYGGSRKIPFTESDFVDNPVSL